MQENGNRTNTNGKGLLALARELATFESNLPALLEKDAGRFVLIHGDQVVGAWDIWADAVAEGYRRFNLEPFLVQRIDAEEKPLFLSREPL